MAPRTGRAKDVPRLPLSAFTPSSDTFPLPPTPSFISPTAVADAHCGPGAPRLGPPHRRAVVLAPADPPQPVVDARVLAVLAPFALNGPQRPSDPLPRALSATYDGAIPVAAGAEEDRSDLAQVEAPVENLRWALQHARVVDLAIKGGILDTDASLYDSLVNLLTKAIKSQSDTTRSPIVLTNLLPPPLDSVPPIVSIVNHPTYTTFRQRVTLLSLFESVHVKLLPPAWVADESSARLDPKREKEFRDILKLFIAPVLEAFGFDRIIFGSSPASARGPPLLAEIWYNLVLGSFRELAVSQDEMDKIFVDNAERVYAPI